MAVGLILALGLAGCGGKATEPGLTVNFVESSAEAILPDGTSRAVKPGESVPYGSTLKASGGSVDVGVDAGRAVRLTDGAEVAPTAAKDGVDWKLMRGSLVVNIKSAGPDKREFRVATPAGVCGARGTAFYVKSEQSSMSVGVENGEVYLKGAAGGEVTIPAGHKAVATLTAPVTDVEKLLEQDRAFLTHVNFMNFDVVVESIKKTAAAVDVKSIESSLEIYRAMHERYPARLEEAIEGSRDPWGTPFNYIPNAEGDNYQLSSSGPDGKVNTSDDIRLK